MARVSERALRQIGFRISPASGSNFRAFVLQPKRQGVDHGWVSHTALLQSRCSAHLPAYSTDLRWIYSPIWLEGYALQSHHPSVILKTNSADASLQLSLSGTFSIQTTFDLGSFHIALGDTGGGDAVGLIAEA